MAETLASLMELTSAALKEMAKDAEIPGRSGMSKEELAKALLKKQKASAPKTAAAKATKKGSDDTVKKAVEDIRSAFKSGVKIAQVANADPGFQAAVTDALEDDEKCRVCFGGGAANLVR